MRCAYCHDRLDPEHALCPGCRTRLHVDCVDELGRCPTLGCRGVPVATLRVRLVAPPPLGWRLLARLAPRRRARTARSARPARRVPA